MPVFFREVQFHLQPANLFKQRVSVRLTVRVFSPSRAPVHEQALDVIQRRAPPVRDLHGVQPELRPNWLSVFSPRIASTTIRTLNFAVYCFLVAIARSFATADSEINLLRGLKQGSIIDTSHFHWAKSSEYVTQVTAIGPLGLEYLSEKDDPRSNHS
jgi:hypothetical protein